jgi:hypothetical protein
LDYGYYFYFFYFLLLERSSNGDRGMNDSRVACGDVVLELRSPYSRYYLPLNGLFNKVLILLKVNTEIFLKVSSFERFRNIPCEESP